MLHLLQEIHLYVTTMIALFLYVVHSSQWLATKQSSSELDLECWNFQGCHVHTVFDCGDVVDEVGAIVGAEVALGNDPGQDIVQTTWVSSGQIGNFSQIGLQFPDEGLQTVSIFFILFDRRESKIGGIKVSLV